MSEDRFLIKKAIRFGWDTMKANIGFFIVLLIVAFLIERLPGMLGNFARRDFPLISLTLFMSGWILSFVVQMGLMKISLKFCDGIKGTLDDLLSSFNILLPFVAASILYGLIVFAGFILLIVPGVIWGVKFSLYPYFIVDRNMGPVQALKASAHATTSAKWHLFLFGILLGLINLAGALCFFIGLFATIPTSLVAYAHTYRQLSAEVSDDSPESEAMYVKLETD